VAQNALEGQEFLLDARAARIMRELHPPCASSCRKNRAKPIGMVHVKDSGLVMKLRGMMLNFVPEPLRPRSLCFILCRRFFFPFDPGGGFL
jgi:hypothetical protein